MELQFKIQQLINNLDKTTQKGRHIYDIQSYLRDLLKLHCKKTETDVLIECIKKYIDAVINFSVSKTVREQMKICSQYLEIIPELIRPDMVASFMKNFTKRVFDILLDEDVDICYMKKELINKLLICTDIASKEVRDRAVQNLPDFYLFKLVDSISSYGNFDLQASIVELVFRMYGRSTILSKLKDLIPESEELSESFASIHGDTFDEDVRKFLNSLNKNSSTIFSIPCNNVLIGNIECGESENANELWVDFSMSEGAVSWYTSISSFVTDTDKNLSDPLWTLITFFNTDVEYVQVYRTISSSTAVIYFKLKVPCICSYDGCTKKITDANEVKIVVSKTSSKLTTLILKILPSIFKYKFRHNTPKMSMQKNVYKPLRISINRRTRSSSSKTRSASSKTRSDGSSFAPSWDPVETCARVSSAKVQSVSSTSTRCEVISTSSSSSSNIGTSVVQVKNHVLDSQTRQESQYETAQMCILQNLMEDRNNVRFSSGLCSNVVDSDDSFSEEPQTHTKILSGRCSGSKASAMPEESVPVKISEPKTVEESDVYETANEILQKSRELISQRDSFSRYSSSKASAMPEESSPVKISEPKNVEESDVYETANEILQKSRELISQRDSFPLRVNVGQDSDEHPGRVDLDLEMEDILAVPACSNQDCEPSPKVTQSPPLDSSNSKGFKDKGAVILLERIAIECVQYSSEHSQNSPIEVEMKGLKDTPNRSQKCEKQPTSEELREVPLEEPLVDEIVEVRDAVRNNEVENDLLRTCEIEFDKMREHDEEEKRELKIEAQDYIEERTYSQKTIIHSCCADHKCSREQKPDSVKTLEIEEENVDFTQVDKEPDMLEELNQDAQLVESDENYNILKMRDTRGKHITGIKKDKEPDVLEESNQDAQPMKPDENLNKLKMRDTRRKHITGIKKDKQPDVLQESNQDAQPVEPDENLNKLKMRDTRRKHITGIKKDKEPDVLQEPNQDAQPVESDDNVNTIKMRYTRGKHITGIKKDKEPDVLQESNQDAQPVEPDENLNKLKMRDTKRKHITGIKKDKEPDVLQEPNQDVQPVEPNENLNKLTMRDTRRKHITGIKKDKEPDVLEDSNQDAQPAEPDKNLNKLKMTDTRRKHITGIKKDKEPDVLEESNQDAQPAEPDKNLIKLKMTDTRRKHITGIKKDKELDVLQESNQDAQPVEPDENLNKLTMRDTRRKHITGIKKDKEPDVLEESNQDAQPAEPDKNLNKLTMRDTRRKHITGIKKDKEPDVLQESNQDAQPVEPDENLNKLKMRDTRRKHITGIKKDEKPDVLQESNQDVQPVEPDENFNKLKMKETKGKHITTIKENKEDRSIHSQTLSTTLGSKRMRKLYNPNDLSYLENLTVLEEIGPNLEHSLNRTGGIKNQVQQVINTTDKTKPAAKPVQKRTSRKQPNTAEKKIKSKSKKTRKLKPLNPDAIFVPDYNASRLKGTFYEMLAEIRREAKVSLPQLMNSKHEYFKIEVPSKKRNRDKKNSTKKTRNNILRDRRARTEKDSVQSDSSLQLNKFTANKENKTPEPTFLNAEEQATREVYGSRKINVISDIQIRPKRVLLDDDSRIPKKKMRLVKDVDINEEDNVPGSSITDQEISQWITTGSPNYQRTTIESQVTLRNCYLLASTLLDQPKESVEYQNALKVCKILKTYI